MLDRLLELRTEQMALLLPMLGIIGACLVACTAILAGNWRKARQAEFDAHLKSEMLEQGKTIEEIERVLEAGRYTGSRKRKSRDRQYA